MKCTKKKKLVHENRGKKKTHKHKQICGIVPGSGWGGKKLFMCFFLGHSLWGRKTHKQNPPKTSRDNPVKQLFRCFLLYVFSIFFAPNCARETRGMRKFHPSKKNKCAVFRFKDQNSEFNAHSQTWTILSTIDSN